MVGSLASDPTTLNPAYIDPLCERGGDAVEFAAECWCPEGVTARIITRAMRAISSPYSTAEAPSWRQAYLAAELTDADLNISIGPQHFNPL